MQASSFLGRLLLEQRGTNGIIKNFYTLVLLKI